MKPWLKWLLAVVVVLLLLLGGVALALQRWVSSSDFRDRVGRQVSVALGVPVQLGHMTVNVWPLPALALDQVRVGTHPAITLERIEVRPAWTGLWEDRPEIATVVVRNAVVPEQAVASIAAAASSKSPHAAGSRASVRAAVLPRHLVLDRLTWIDAKGQSTTVDAQAQLGDDALPATAQLEVRQGRFQGAHISLERQLDHWTLHAAIGGGTIDGMLQLQASGKGPSLLQGQLDSAGVEVSALTAPSRTLTGKLQARTTLRAEFREWGGLSNALQTETHFTVREAVVHGIDLKKAVQSAGLNRGGETHLDTLTGEVSTRERATRLSNVVATMDTLAANANVVIAPDRSLNGRVVVDLPSATAGGALKVPMVVGGTLDAPTVTPTREALIGAAVGAAMAQGSGAKLGDSLAKDLRNLFGK